MLFSSSSLNVAVVLLAESLLLLFLNSLVKSFRYAYGCGYSGTRYLLNMVSSCSFSSIFSSIQPHLMNSTSVSKFILRYFLVLLLLMLTTLLLLMLMLMLFFLFSSSDQPRTPNMPFSIFTQEPLTSSSPQCFVTTLKNLPESRCTAVVICVMPLLINSVKARQWSLRTLLSWLPISSINSTSMSLTLESSSHINGTMLFNIGVIVFVPITLGMICLKWISVSFLVTALWCLHSESLLRTSLSIFLGVLLRAPILPWFGKVIVLATNDVLVTLLGSCLALPTFNFALRKSCCFSVFFFPAILPNPVFLCGF